ncbi:hypothetical protein ONZ45_g5546 [Pleurotus djamor]|nr:hypothetical protein ONZ45_g5546 [Pleurotus djamor]
MGMLTSSLLLLSFWTVFFTRSYAEARLLSSARDVKDASYDFVIVGAGTAGSVLANRLTENPKIRVLIIEAGATNDGVLATVVPFLGVSLANTVVDWNFTASPQPHLLNRTFHYARGHVLGGSSTINIMTWNRGSNDVWDNWAKITNFDAWKWKNIEPYYLKTSRIVPPADSHNTEGEFIPAAHGQGPVQVSLPGFPTELDDMVIGASKELGGRFQFNQDLNSGTLTGIGVLQASIATSVRSSAATSYLEPVENRKNLDILINTRATKLVPSLPISGKPSFKTVELTQSPSSPSFRVHAKLEIIVATGVIGTPQLLQLSGIGPRSLLKQNQIPTIVDLPSVGQNFTDHPMVPNYYLVNSTKTFDIILRDESVFGTTLGEWMSNGTGLFVDSPANTLGFMRLPSNSPVLKRFSDPSSGPRSAHTELIFVDGYAQFGDLAQPATGSFLTLLSAVVSPVSRGSVTITSSDPFVNPTVNPNIYASDFDILAMVQAMKDGREFISSPRWNGFILSPFGDLVNATTDDQLIEYARNFTVTVNHPVGTAAMSPKNAKWGVVDPDLLVKGTSGLRVVDASIFPKIPECHTQSLVYTVAERAADFIKAAHGC